MKSSVGPIRWRLEAGFETDNDDLRVYLWPVLRLDGFRVTNELMRDAGWHWYCDGCIHFWKWTWSFLWTGGIAK